MHRRFGVSIQLAKYQGLVQYGMRNDKNPYRKSGI